MNCYFFTFDEIMVKVEGTNLSWKYKFKMPLAVNQFQNIILDFPIPCYSVILA